MAANTLLNPGVGGDKVRDIDLGGNIKLQAMIHLDPSLIQAIRDFTATAWTNHQIIAGIAGSRMLVTRFKARLRGDVDADVAILSGFGTPTPTGAGVVYSHPGLPPGLADGENGDILGVGADAQGLFITTGTITTGTLEVNVTYCFLPTAGF